MRSTAQVTERNGETLIIRELGDLALDVEATRLSQSPVRITAQVSGSHRGATRLQVEERARSTRLVQRYKGWFTFVAPSQRSAKPSRQTIAITGRIDYLIEVRPAQE